jgi:hypothetical protein
MAQSCDVKSYDMENVLTARARAPSPQIPHPGSLLPGEDVSASKVEAPTVSAVLGGMVRHPVRHLISRWNWKSALFSSLLRAAIFFFFTNLIAGWHAALGAMLPELWLRSVTSGFYGAITESFSSARPTWAATAAAMVVLQFLAHSVEFVVHWLRGTPKLGLRIGTSLIFTALSTAFNLYAMRRGILVTSANSKTLRHDITQIPPGSLVGRGLPPTSSFFTIVCTCASGTPRGIGSSRGGPLSL